MSTAFCSNLVVNAPIRNLEGPLEFARGDGVYEQEGHKEVDCVA